MSDAGAAKKICYKEKKKTLNILFLAYNYPHELQPLTAPFCRDHALALSKAGHNVVVMAALPITLRMGIKNWLKAFRAGSNSQTPVYDKGVESYVFPFAAFPKMLRFNSWKRTRIIYRNANKLLENGRSFDFIHVHGFQAGGAAAIICKKWGIKFAITEHSTLLAKNEIERKWEKFGYKVFQAASLCIAVSRHFAIILGERFGLPFYYVPNVVNMAENLCESKISHDQIQIVSVGSLTQRKNHQRLLNAFLQARLHYPKINLQIVGSGEMKKQLVEFIRKNGLEQCVVLHGAVSRERVLQIIASSDLFALPSDVETFGVVLVEALYCGLPVLATDCGGPGSIIEDDSIGLLTQNNDESFANGLLKIVERYRQGYYSQQGIIDYAKQHFSPEVVVSQLERLYEDSGLICK